MTGALVATGAIRAIGGARRAPLVAGTAFLAAATLVATGAGAAVAATVAVALHLAVVAAVLLVVLVAALWNLPIAPAPPAPAAEPRAAGRSAAGGRGRPVRRACWAAVVVVVVAGLAAVLIGRLGLDRAVDALGWTVVARLAGVLAAVATSTGLALGASTGQPAPVLIGVGLAAVGTGAAAPLLFDRAGHLATRVGLAADAGPGLVSGVFRLGVLVSPLLVGAIATGAGLFLALGVSAAAGATIAALAGPLTRDHLR